LQFGGFCNSVVSVLREKAWESSSFIVAAFGGFSLCAGFLLTMGRGLGVIHSRQLIRLSVTNSQVPALLIVRIHIRFQPGPCIRSLAPPKDPRRVIFSPICLQELTSFALWNRTPEFRARAQFAPDMTVAAVPLCTINNE